MSPRLDGFYLSGRLRGEDWHAGVCLVREYVRYLLLFEDGRWLHKDHPTADLDFLGYVASVTVQDFRDSWAGRHPFDSDYNFVHQSGQYFQSGQKLVFVFRHELLGLHELRWQLRVRSPRRLVSESGTVFAFH